MPMKRPWMIIGGATAAVAIGATGFALTSADGDDQLPGGIALEDGRPIPTEGAADQSPDEFELVPNPVQTANATDSPDPSPSATDAADDSPDPSPSATDAADDSPDPSPSATDAADDSPDPSPDSVDSPDSTA